ncbi:hypothetical protein LX97_01148 [Nonlabens dokdonensis]|uniref:Uncharacterized protein n=3 Tax=Nonlabens dokdonensis TaxID=328515 RepID=L7W4F8_NONDD|nr:hypothetical protein DDD_1358 [Nonlabens dokdonensis DSW-6]PZX44139.1 hypothetical protein LX97_01148 [Nonlabens dokdonensis]
MIFGAIYMLAVLGGLGFGSYFIIEELELGEPIRVVNQYLIYYFFFDLAMRYMLQKMPVTNIKPLLYLPITRSNIVKYALGKTSISFFNIAHAFFFIPFSIVLLVKGDAAFINVLGWHLAMICITYTINYLNVFMNNMDSVFYPVIGLIAASGILQYYGIFDITNYSAPVFDFFYDNAFGFIIPLALAISSAYFAFNYFKNQLYLDAGLKTEVKEASTEDLSFLDRFGKVSTYLKNDIKLIKRNKRARTTFLVGFLFVFYGFFFMNEIYDSINGMKVFAGLFCTGGFLFMFGGLVPSWDSSYYKLMMSQNIPYRDFLLSKWWLMIVSTVVSTLLCTLYLYFGWDWWFAMIAGAIYNIGFNSSVVLLGGAYVKTPIDLMSSKKAFGDSKAFNAKTLLLVIPKLFLPVLIYYAFALTINESAGFIAIAVTGVLGLLFRNKIFDLIERVYKKEKYDTIAAYAQKD